MRGEKRLADIFSDPLKMQARSQSRRALPVRGNRVLLPVKAGYYDFGFKMSRQSKSPRSSP